MKTLPRDRERIDIKLQKVLDSFDSLERIEASPFFYTRLKSAITEAERERSNWLYRLTRGYKLLPATMLIITILNVVSLSLAFTLRQSNVSTETTEQNNTELPFSLSRWQMFSETGR